MRESRAWLQPHDSPGSTFTMICPASPYCPTFCDFSPFCYLFLLLFNISCLPVPYQELCAQREFTCKTAVQSSVPFSEKSAVKRAERWAGSAWWSAFKLLDALQWLKIVIFQSNKHTIHELKLRIFLTVLFHNLYLIWINKPFVPPQTYLNLTDLIHQLPFSSNNGLPYHNNAFVL